MSDEIVYVVSEWPAPITTLPQGYRDSEDKSSASKLKFNAKRARLPAIDHGHSGIRTGHAQDEDPPNSLTTQSQRFSSNDDCRSCHFEQHETADVALAKWWRRRKIRRKSEDTGAGERCCPTTKILRIARYDDTVT